MKRLLMCVVTMALVSSAAMAETNTVPEYRTTELRRVDGGGAKRVVVYVTVGAGLTPAQVKRVIENVVIHNVEEHAIQVAVSEHGCAPTRYTVAKGDWAPGGEWSRALEGRLNNSRSNYKLNIDYRESYFKRKTAPKWPAKVGLTWEQVNRMCGELEVACMAASNKVFEKHPTGNKAAADKARSNAIATVGRKYGLSGDVAEKVWEKWMEEIY